MLFSLVFFFSCSEDSGTDSNGDGFGNNGGFKVTIDGSSWQAGDFQVFAVISVGEATSVLSISASKSIPPASAEAFAISIGQPVSNASGLEGTHNFGPTGMAALSFIQSNSSDVTSYLSLSGQVKITNVSSSKVTGTFNATCVNTLDEMDTITLTNGSFSAPITTSDF